MTNLYVQFCWLRIHRNVVFSYKCIPRQLCYLYKILAARTAAPSSSLLIVCAAYGANFAFPRINPVWHAPCSLTTRRYATAAIALTEASEKT